jgi:hypothetical protein
VRGYVSEIAAAFAVATPRAAMVATRSIVREAAGVDARRFVLERANPNAP